MAIAHREQELARRPQAIVADRQGAIVVMDEIEPRAADQVLAAASPRSARQFSLTLTKRPASVERADHVDRGLDHPAQFLPGLQGGGFADGKLLGAKLRRAERLGELRVRRALSGADDRERQAREDRDDEEELQEAAAERGVVAAARATC